MTQKDRKIQRRLRILKHGEAGLVRGKPVPKNPMNRTPPEEAAQGHTTRYEQQVPGHQIRVDVQLLIFR